jgi:hypothetical protein
MKNINLVELERILKENEEMIGFDYVKETKTVRLFTSNPYFAKELKNSFSHPFVDILCGKKGHVR